MYLASRNLKQTLPNNFFEAPGTPRGPSRVATPILKGPPGREKAPPGTPRNTSKVTQGVPGPPRPPLWISPLQRYFRQSLIFKFHIFPTFVQCVSTTIAASQISTCLILHMFPTFFVCFGDFFFCFFWKFSKKKRALQKNYVRQINCQKIFFEEILCKTELIALKTLFSRKKSCKMFLGN